MGNIQEQIHDLIQKHSVILFIKGSRSQPLCGFSNTVINIFNLINVPYSTVNVLENDEIRQGIKSYSNWPTIPQIYIQGEFIGGADIVIDLYQSGELQEKVEKATAI